MALLLIHLFPDSLLLVSAYGLIDNLVRVLLGSTVGSFIDRSGSCRASTTAMSHMHA